MNTKPITFTFAAVALLVMLLILAGLNNRGGDPPEPFVKSDLTMIHQAIFFYTINNRDMPADFEKADAVRWFQILSNNLPDNPTWSKERKLVDRWGGDLQFAVSTISNKSGQIEIKIWSNGRNGRNEQGKGDDIEVVQEYSKGF